MPAVWIAAGIEKKFFGQGRFSRVRVADDRKSAPFFTGFFQTVSFLDRHKYKT